jgi:hypothetical protein
VLVPVRAEPTGTKTFRAPVVSSPLCQASSMSWPTLPAGNGCAAAHGRCFSRSFDAMALPHWFIRQHRQAIQVCGLTLTQGRWCSAEHGRRAAHPRR